MIECQDVSFSYPASTLPDSERQAGGALKHISCTIEDGSFVLLCGTSGCGKTTMTRLFNGLIPHYHEGTYTGSVYLDGKDTRDLSLFDISLKVGSVFQNPRSQFFNVDTTSELAFGPENHGIAEDLVRDRVKRVAAQLKLEPLLDRSIFSLSGGEKQKIACGSAAAIDPDIYVLDEPSSNLDAYAIADFRQLLFTLKSQGKTIIISEHRLYYLSGLFDRVLYLKDGEIEGDYTAEEFCGLSARQRDDMGLRPLDLAGLSEVVGTPQRMNEAVWTIKNVSFAYKHEPETLHITETSFPSGSATAIIGHNGAGKSTFARCLCGLEKHFKGTVQDQSKNYSRKERLKLCYMVMQDVNHQLFTEDVLDELLLSMGGEDEKADTARAKEILNSLDLLDKVKLHPMSLSGGEKQKIAFASVYAMNPQIYLLDEPSSNLDMTSIQELKEHLRLIKKQGKTVLIAEHRLYYLMELADRIVYLEKGEIKGIYTPEEFRQLSEQERERMGLRAVDLRAVFPPKPHSIAPIPVLELRNVTLRYKKRTILHDIGLSAGKGEVIGVVGHNGAGKTTFSRALCGLHKDCDGQFLWESKPIERKERLQRSYMVMQDVNYELFADSVEAECSFGIRNPDQTLVNATLEELGLTQYRERHPNTLSGGQKQRVAVAVSMICGKDLLVFDEPTSGLDFDSMTQVAGLIRRLSNMGKVIFIVTHDFEFVCRTCSRVLHFDEGEMPDDVPVTMDALPKLRELFSVSDGKER